ncbi:Oxidoreductase [Streptomyces sp. FR-008]|nr:Oxidoreductase [Streptomyces sp. FR-008]
MPHPAPTPEQVLRTDLARALAAGIAGEADFSVTARALNTMDASNYRRVPLGTVAPRDADDVAATLAVCREYGVPVVARGAGTSIAGQATGTGVVLDFTRHMNGLLALDPEARTARVQPGLILDRLRDAAAPHGLTFGPDPSTHSRCTLGGMIGNNSCGSHSVAWGTTADNVHALDVRTYQGTAHHLTPGDWTGAPDGLRDLVHGHLALLRTGYPELPRRISGYALDALLPERGADLPRFFCGTEGTLGLVTEATVRLVEAPPARALAVLGYADESAAAEAAPGLLPYAPLTVEGMAADLVPDPRGLPRGGAWLFVETGGATRAEARRDAEALARAADATDSLVVDDPAGQRALWRVREDASGTATRMPDGSEAWPGWEDCAVPPARLGAYLRDFRALLADHGLRGTPYGHFGDGCIHVRIDFDLLTPDGVGRFRRFSEELAALVVRHGGSLSGEHGDGMARAELLPALYGDDLVRLFGDAKDVWDPDGALNPGVLVRPAPLDADLRFAVLPTTRVDTAFAYPHDDGDFSAAVRRCVGVAKCRTETVSGPAVMCPSFRATGEEEHSTRGRARLLHEMLAGTRGGLVTDGWRSPEVRDALDLCLSCKGCRSDCPVGVDMATYKAEFLHHHYDGRLRPRAHYALGRLPRWLRLAAPAAPLLNAAARIGPLATAAKYLAGIAPRTPHPAAGRPRRAPPRPHHPRPPRRRPRPPLPRHLHHPPHPLRRGRRPPRTRRRRTDPPHPEGPRLLRPHLRLHRPARRRPQDPAPHPRHPGTRRAARPGRHHPAHRPRTELRRRPRHRPARTPPGRPARPPPRRPRPHLRPDPPRRRLPATPPRPPRHRPDPLPPARRPRHRGRPHPARTRRPHRPPHRRLLRPRRQLRLRTGPLRGLRRLRRGPTPPRPGRRPHRRRCPHRRLLLPYAAHAVERGAAEASGGGAGGGAGGPHLSTARPRASPESAARTR